jgi:hypothetical protein
VRRRASSTIVTRVPLLALGFASLAVGVAAGLGRLGWPVPALAGAAAPAHAPLMIGGFLGVLIALERAVAIRRAAAYLAPLLAGAGAIAAIAHATFAPILLMAAGSAVLVGASVAVWRRQPALFTATLLLGAACWLAGNLLWAAGRPVPEVVAWWMSFLVLTIAGERLELSRFLPPSPSGRRVFIAVVALLVAGLAIAASGGGAIVWAVALVALAAWLLRNDIARRTIRGRGLTRFCAVALLSGYAWLAIGGGSILAAGGLYAGSRAYDASIHAVALGFVFSMIFAHAPIILPAVLRVPFPYHPTAYVPLALLHASVALRVAGDYMSNDAVVRNAALLNAVALGAFIVLGIVMVVGARLAARERAELRTP